MSTTSTGRKTARSNADKWLAAGSFVAIIGIWEILARLIALPFFVPPSKIVVAAQKLWLSGPPIRLWTTPLVTIDILPSLGRLFLGWALGLAAALILGIVLGSVRLLNQLLSPVLEFGRALPPVALVPIFIIFFGIGDQMKVLLIAFTTFWPLLLNTIAGVQSIAVEHLETARAFSIGRIERFRRILIPAVMPYVFAGLRITTSAALIIMVISEMMGSSTGIGFRLLDAQLSFRFGALWAGLILLGIIGLLLNVMVERLEHRALRWQPPAIDDEDGL